MHLLKRTVFAALILGTIGAAALADGKIGVVLLHGKTGMPHQFAQLAAALKAAGFTVDTPEMCWSKARIFDKAFPDCLAEVDTAVSKLRAAGDSAIVVGGTSQGGIGALAYGATHGDLAGIIAMAPAAGPGDTSSVPALAKSIAAAQAMLKSGQSDKPTTFDDVANGGTITVHATPKAFLSFHDSDAPASTLHNLTQMTLPKIHVPVLWIAGTSDPSQKNAKKSFAAIPKQSASRYATVDADHEGTPDASADIVIAWLKTLH